MDPAEPSPPSRKEQIVRAALGLLADVPMEEITTRRLAAELGLTQPALFRHFESREAILLAVVAAGRRDLEQVALAVIESDAPALDRLRQLGAALLLHVEAHPGFPRLLFAAALPGAGPVREAMRHIVTMQAALVGALVEEGQAAGSLDRFVAPEHAAGLYVGMLQGLVLRWEVGARQGRAIAGYAELFGLWARGMGARPAGEVRPGGPGSLEAEVDPHSVGPAHRGHPVVRPHGPAIQFVDGAALIATGTDPLATVLATLGTLPPAGVLVFRAPFRPTPLVALLRKRGLAVHEEPLDEGHWLLLVVLGDHPIEDLREFEPPEPLERVLLAEARLPRGGVHLARVPRMPQLLLERLVGREVRALAEALPDGSALVRLERA